MLLLLRLQLFAAVLVSAAFGDSEMYFRAVVPDPIPSHQYVYRFDACFQVNPAYKDLCWASDANFTTMVEVQDYYVT